MSRNLESVRTAHENWNRRNFEAVVRDLAETVTYTNRARTETLTSKNQFRQFVEAWAKAFPNGKIVNNEYLEAGETVIAQFTMRGTNDGSFMGLAPTGKEASVNLCEIVTFENGKVVSANLYYDQYSVLTQLGHLKPLAAAA